ESHVDSVFDAGQDFTTLQDTGQGVNLPADVTHWIDAALYDAAVPGLHDSGMVAHGLADGSEGTFTLEALSDANKVTVSPPSTALKASIQSTLASASDTNAVTPVTADTAGTHADATKTSYGGSLNDADQPAQAWLDYYTPIDAHQPPGSAATRPTSNHLGSGSTISTDAAPAATNDTVSFNRVVSSPLQSASDMQNQAVTPLSNSPVAGSTGSAPDSSSASSPQSIATSVSPQKSIATPVQL